MLICAKISRNTHCAKSVGEKISLDDNLIKFKTIQKTALERINISNEANTFTINLVKLHKYLAYLRPDFV